METASSMSISILRGDRLWGLISCHHCEPKTSPFDIQATCDLYARMFSLRLSTLELSRDYERRIAIQSAFATLLAVVADRGDFSAALSEHPRELISFADSSGAAILTEGDCLLVGETPSQDQSSELAAWLSQTQHQDVFATESLATIYPPAEAFQQKAAGILAIAISKLHPSYVIWFRPEVIQTLKWGGDPRKAFEPESEDRRIRPRRSFETWMETVRGKSAPWRSSEIEGASELRNALVGIVLRKAEELAQLNAELRRSNKELESFSYSVSHDLRAPLRHIVGYAEMLKEQNAGQLSDLGNRCVRTIIDSSEYAGNLVDKLLSYSRMGRAQLQLTSINMNMLVAETIRGMSAETESRQIDWRVADLPVIEVDLMMFRDAIRNLLENALKYTRHRDQAIIEVGSRDDGRERVFWVRDNGVGFEQKYAGKLFGVFQRLHRIEDYQGTGIGLANVRRVIERHGGRTWAEGEENRGATFYFSLPKRET